jgi:2-C-methyl-D-erythritol 2,4-cyclodiphosphate synthase
MKIGFGYDVHKFEQNRPLILGGVTIPHTHGLLGHSDADVLTHAIMDALLGALNMGSIGDHFPDNDTKYKDISSLILLEHVKRLLEKKGYEIGNIDSVLALQEPKMKPHITRIQESLATCLAIAPDLISVKATTTEKLGFEGRKEGISSYAVVLINKK